MKNGVNQRIKELRIALDLQPSDLAKISDVSLPQIMRLEDGDNEPRTDTVLKIAEATNASPAWLAKKEGEMFQYGMALDQAKERVRALLAEKKGKRTDPYRDALVTELKEQVEFYKELLRNLTTKKSFLKVLSMSGVERNVAKYTQAA